MVKFLKNRKLTKNRIPCSTICKQAYHLSNCVTSIATVHVKCMQIVVIRLSKSTMKHRYTKANFCHNSLLRAWCKIK